MSFAPDVGDFDQLYDIFIKACGLPSAECEACLAELKQSNPQLARKVHALLERDARCAAKPTDDAGAGAAVAATLLAIPPERPGTYIGPYQLLKELGEGGFGTVFLAEQKQPVARKVALKIIKLGMDTRQVVARFEQERQALAIMDHPNVARVFDAGTTEAGRPYFVMELCTGEPITDYCDKHKLSIAQRLKLFVQVCHAVQHAHLKGVIHRDIKPSNILVSAHDGKPFAKVIDFGIAKATQSKLTEKTVFTTDKQLIGTPEYMSPEQAEGSKDIDTRTDIYSLGVLLYELLTGSTPFDAKTLRSAAYAEIQRIIREVEPPKPSTRLQQSRDTIASVAASRDTEPKKLGTLVRGELDWIVMKALEKERVRRYESPNALGADVQRYLSDEAVVAAPASRRYRLRKFAWRHKGAVVAGAAVIVVLVGGIATTSWQAVRATRAEQNARAREIEARDQAAIAQTINSFLQQMLSAADPNRMLGDKVTVSEVMRGALRKLDDGAMQDQPLVEAGLRQTIGETFSNLGRHDLGQTSLLRSLAVRRKARPIPDQEFARNLTLLAYTYQANDEWEQAESLHREAMDILQRLQKLLPAVEQDPAAGMTNVAGALFMLGRLDEAEAIYQKVLAIHSRAKPSPLTLAASKGNIGCVLQARGKYASAEAIFRETLATYREEQPAGHPGIAVCLCDLARVLFDEGKFKEAETVCRESLAMRRRILSPEHWYVGEAANLLGTICDARGRKSEAEALLREGLQIRRQILPGTHRDLADSLHNLGFFLKNEGRLREAEPLLQEALAIRRPKFGTRNVLVEQTAALLADLFDATERPQQAAALRSECGLPESTKPAATFPPTHSAP